MAQNTFRVAKGANINGADCSSAVQAVAAVSGFKLGLRQAVISASAACNITVQDSAASPVVLVPKMYMPANSVLVVKAPQPAVATSASGVSYNQYNVYVSETEGEETEQSGATSTSSNWTEPGTGLVSGDALPTDSGLEPLGGWVIQFRYMPAVTKLTDPSDVLLIPNRYEDVVCAGVSALGAQFNARETTPQDEGRSERWAMMYERGIQRMLRDQNPWGPSNFIRPDPESVVNPMFGG